MEEEKKITLKEALNLSRRRRRYYLHFKLKNEAGLSIDSHSHSINITEKEMEELNEINKKRIEELRDDFYYNIQTCIPC